MLNPQLGSVEWLVSLDDTDVIMLFADQPIIIVPVSERATALFYRWGMEHDDFGIAPPDDPTDLLDSMPNNWMVKGGRVDEFINVDSLPPPEDPIKFTDVHLPQPLLVVH